jgi:hypothetical protein
MSVKLQASKGVRREVAECSSSGTWCLGTLVWKMPAGYSCIGRAQIWHESLGMVEAGRDGGEREGCRRSARLILVSAGEER